MTFTKERIIEELKASTQNASGMFEINEDTICALMELLESRADAEPVAWTDEQELRDVEKDGCGYLFTVNPITPNADPRRIIKLYTRPQPAPVVPDEIDVKDPALDTHRKWMAEGWNRCRAAMLKK